MNRQTTDIKNKLEKQLLNIYGSYLKQHKIKKGK